jgi:hexosaminidase
MKITLSFVFVLALSLSLKAQELTELARAGIQLIPYPQEVALKGPGFRIQNNVAVVLDKNATSNDKFAAEELVGFLRSEFNVNARVQAAPSGHAIVLTRRGAERRLGEQGYALNVTSDQVIVRARGETGLFYGVQTLLQVIQKNSSGVYIKGMEIIDWPDTPVRAMHYDTKHHQDTREYVESFIRDLAKYKTNMLVWEWEDKLAYESYPEVGAPGAFTISEMQELTRYARKYHIEIVPLVQGLGHVSFILKYPQHAHLREIRASNWEFCPLKEGSYELLFALWEEAIKATPGSRHIHIGSDETYELGLCDQCKKKAEEIGKSGLYHLFVGKSAKHLQKLGREVMVWERPMGWARGQDAAKNIIPPKGLILTESYGYETPELKYAREARSKGYPVYAYDPNPGIELLFLPYFYRKRNGETVIGSLENSYNFLTSRMGVGVFDGMINTSWDDSGLHNQVWMMSFILSAEFSWTATKPGLPEFTAKFFKNYYGEEATDMEKLFLLLNEGSYYYMETLERNVWHHGAIGKTHLPDLPRTDVFEYDEYWNIEYADQVEKAKEFKQKMDEAINICKANISKSTKNKYDFEVFQSIAEMIKHTTLTYLDLSELEKTIKEGHNQRFLSVENTYKSLEKAEKIITENLARREKVFNDLVATWEKTRLPKGISTSDKEFFFMQDRARHFANRTPDMTYHIYDEQLLGLEEYLEKLRAYMKYFKETFVEEGKSLSEI